MEKKIPIKTYKALYECDECGGEVKSAISLELKPQNTYCGNLIKHKCNTCNKEYWLDKPYPYIKYIEVI
jgi:DNA-directed RNA polymerase subunit RPC12/RpoP